jgi:hypothetical protein
LSGSTENCKHIVKYFSLYKVDPYALSMAMAEKYDDYQSWPIKWATNWVQDNIIENILPDNAYFLREILVLSIFTLQPPFGMDGKVH